MPILERKIAHKMTTLCSHITYPEFVLPLHKHAEYELMIFTHGSGKQFVGEGVAPYAEGDVALIGSNVPHQSIFQVLAEIRIEYACKLLANSDLTITEVAFSSGYNTPTLFFEQFQKIIHLTPAEYRREICGSMEPIGKRQCFGQSSLKVDCCQP